jgi:phosphate transport system substrate-binding protein
MFLLFSFGNIKITFAQEIRGSGSTFAFPVLAQWAAAYGKSGGATIAYQPIGSARGVAEIDAGVVDFAITDAPLADSQLLRDGLLQFPLVIGAIVPVVNLDGIDRGQLHFTGPLLAEIYLGTVKRWRDPAIVALNPGINLPDRPILVIYRTDGSGTTFNWADYLSKVSLQWKAQVGVGTTVAWPAGVGGKGNGGVAEKVALVKGAIGYVEYSYAAHNELTYGLIQNRSGAFVQPTQVSFRAATEAVDWAAEPDFNVMLTDADRPDAYPVMATSFVLMRKYPKEPARAHAMLDFFRWSLDKGQDLAASQGYLPLPPSLVRQVEDSWEGEVRQTAR